jgi:hypothetical protein
MEYVGYTLGEAAINLENFGINELRVASPEVTSVEMEALAYRDVGETTLEEAEISLCTHLYT